MVRLIFAIGILIGYVAPGQTQCIFCDSVQKGFLAACLQKASPKACDCDYAIASKILTPDEISLLTAKWNDDRRAQGLLQEKHGVMWSTAAAAKMMELQSTFIACN